MIHFDSVNDIIEQALLTEQRISDIALSQTAQDESITEAEILDKMKNMLLVMRQSIENGMDENIKSSSGLSGGMAFRVKQNVDTAKNISGSFLGEIIYSALAVSEYNACMGKIVAAPTAGSSGIIPACLVTLQKHYNISDEKIVMGLINASAIGMVIAKKATIAGAEGGCQAECGAAAAMAASAMIEIMGGTPKACGHGAAQALKSVMGLVCDPVAGLVEEPCVIRNASCAATAVMAAELALAGVTSIIPVDEVIDAMGSVGAALPESLRETAKGGIAACPTAIKISERLH